MAQTLRYLLAVAIFIAACVFLLRFVPAPYHMWAVALLVVLVAGFVITWLVRGGPPPLGVILAAIMAGVMVGCGEGTVPAPEVTPVPTQGEFQPCERFKASPNVYTGDCETSPTCKDNGDGSFTGSECHTR